SAQPSVPQRPAPGHPFRSRSSTLPLVSIHTFSFILPPVTRRCRHRPIKELPQSLCFAGVLVHHVILRTDPWPDRPVRRPSSGPPPLPLISPLPEAAAVRT